MKAHHPVVSLREASGQSNALLAPLMHCIRKTATIESAAHCLRYLPKDPRLRPLSSRAEPRRILASCTVNTASSSSSALSSIGHTTTKTTTTSIIRRQAFVGNAKRSSAVSVIAKSHRSSRRPLCSALLAIRDELRRETTTQTSNSSSSYGGKQIPGERQLVLQQFFRDVLV
ncbi:3-isopropylmalate dehydratase large subunit [Anopheles sinensis]|uniref:3-isopropylmalate dehydratase large subunit n=1 Tax=Anopheles sinensis TaxID=74873 RepID=A0A084W9W1_ANOSI|nr:3-isopropylmalate dehydratase large subunit [Anopheles sinensis]